MAPGVAAQALQIGREEDDGLGAAADVRQLCVEHVVSRPDGGGEAGTERGRRADLSVRGALSCLSVWVGAVVR